MERKLATALFVDLVDSTSLLGATDPEIVRRRVTEYFERAAACITRHGGTVEKFAGDAVMAAFGVPQAHEDDSVRAVRAAFAVLDAVRELGLQARAGVEAGEVVVDDGDSTFVTGEAINVAARLQQFAAAGTVALGPGARRLTLGVVEVEDTGAVPVRPGEEVWSWRAVRVLDAPRRRPRAPFVGRERELELLENAYERAVETARPGLVTIFGEPGVGKSRLVDEFTASVERATVLTGRALPYGEGVAFWPIASMVKSSAGITDDDPASEAFEKLRVCCESEAVADLLGFALGVLGAAGGTGAGEEIPWATLRWAEQLAQAQPLVLVFEDVHWADERVLDTIEHLARSLVGVPVLIVCVARLDLLDVRPDWGGGNPRAQSIELMPLTTDEAAELVDLLLPPDEPPARRALVLERAEGNPLFLEETALMLGEGDGAIERIPETVQALIAARLDLLPAGQKRVLQHAAVIGRVFWRGALERLLGQPRVEESLEALLERGLIEREERSTLPGDRPFRFKHVLIRDVAYTAMTKAERAARHQTFAAWLGERAGDELVEIRAHHLDVACALLRELDGRVPANLAGEAAAVIQAAGERALARESFASARRFFQRANELEPALARRYLAASAARLQNEVATVVVEMERVRAEAHAAGDSATEGRALTALAEAAMARDGNPARAAELAAQALELLPEDATDDRADALRRLAAAAWWVGDLSHAEAYTRRAIDAAHRAGRTDLWVRAMTTLQWLLELRLDLDAADDALVAALEPEREGVLADARARHALGSLRRIQGRLGEAETELREARRLFAQAGSTGDAAWSGVLLGWIALVHGDTARAERLFRDGVRIFSQSEDHGHLCEAQRALAEVLRRTGRLGEAERHALAAASVVSVHDLTSRSSTLTTLGLVRASQGRDEEAEALLRESLTLLEATDFRLLETAALVALASFLRDRGRDAEASELEARLPARVPAWLGAEDAQTAARELAAAE